MGSRRWFFLLWNVHCLVFGIYGDTLVEITPLVFGDQPPNALLAAFGDFNADRFTDLFFIADHGKTLLVYLASESTPLLKPSPIKCEFQDEILITGVVPGDYDGDSQMDVLLTYIHTKQDTNSDHIRHWKILWGNQSHIDCGSLKEVDDLGEFYGEPLVVDFDGNRIPDVFGQYRNRTRRVAYLMQNHRNGSAPGMKILYPALPGISDDRTIRTPHSNSFVDISGDMVADLIVTTEGLLPKDNGIEIWLNRRTEFSLYKFIHWPSNIAIIGQILVVDIDLDQRIDILLPVCYDYNCNNSAILLLDLDHENWLTMFDSHSVGFIPPMETSHLAFAQDTITLHAGDYNLDGYPDVIAILRDPSNKKNTGKAYILQNVPSNMETKRTFDVQWNTNGLKDLTNVVLAAFFDLGNDGVLDVLVVQEMSPLTSWKIHAYKNAYASDAFFIKVIVLSGLCYRHCPNKRVPFGTNQPGPTVCYNLAVPDRIPQSSCAGQLTQSAHFALQLPYVSFGLGHVPNFVDSLTVTIPGRAKQQTLKHEWHGIIPNSQMFVIPYLETEGQKWFNKLYVTPSHLVLITFEALLGTMIAIAFVVFGLHLKERREDRKEKLQEAHRFHFDAM